MLVSYKWLNDYLDLSEISPNELADKMSVTGIEVEGIEVPAAGLKKIVVGEVKECGTPRFTDRGQCQNQERQDARTTIQWDDLFAAGIRLF